MKPYKKVRRLGLFSSLLITILASVLLYGLTDLLSFLLNNVYGQEVILLWFVTVGMGIFIPSTITGLLMVKSEGLAFSKPTLKLRLRFNPLTRRDLIWAIAGWGLAGGIILAIQMMKEWLPSVFSCLPSAMAFEPFSEERCWLLLIWFPYWVLAVLGEEFFWRGVVFPRQEVVFGKYTWIIHGLGWSLSYIALGGCILLPMLPFSLILSFVVQKTKNSWVGVIIHAGVNGPAFIAFCLGLW